MAVIKSTAITRAVKELQKQGFQVEEYGEKGLYRINDRFIIQESNRQMFDEASDWTKTIPPFTPKREIKSFIKNYLNSLEKFETPQPPLPIEQNTNQQPLL